MSVRFWAKASPPVSTEDVSGGGNDELQHGHGPQSIQNVMSLRGFDMSNGVMHAFQCGILGSQNRGGTRGFGWDANLPRRRSLRLLPIENAALSLLFLDAHIIEGNIDRPMEIFVNCVHRGRRNLAVRGLIGVIFQPGLADPVA